MFDVGIYPDKIGERNSFYRENIPRKRKIFEATHRPLNAPRLNRLSLTEGKAQSA
jgi:hypothetical protein